MTFDEFYKEYEKTIDVVVNGFYNLKTAKEDLKQDCLIQIWKYFDRINEVENKKGYVYTLCFNYCNSVLLNEHRKGLWLDDAGYRDYIDIFKTDNKMIYAVKTKKDKKGNVVVIDEYVERWNERKREYNRQYYKKTIEKQRERDRKRSKDPKRIEQLKSYQRKYRAKKKAEKLAQENND